MRQEKLRHLPEFTTSMEEIRKRLLDEIFKTYNREEILGRFKPEERLTGLKPEERLTGLKPEEVINALSKTQLEKLKKLLNSQS